MEVSLCERIYFDSKNYTGTVHTEETINQIPNKITNNYVNEDTEEIPKHFLINSKLKQNKNTHRYYKHWICLNILSGHVNMVLYKKLN